MAPAAVHFGKGSSSSSHRQESLYRISTKLRTSSCMLALSTIDGQWHLPMAPAVCHTLLPRFQRVTTDMLGPPWRRDRYSMRRNNHRLRYGCSFNKVSMGSKVMYRRPKSSRYIKHHGTFGSAIWLLRYDNNKISFFLFNRYQSIRFWPPFKFPFSDNAHLIVSSMRYFTVLFDRGGACRSINPFIFRSLVFKSRP